MSNKKKRNRKTQSELIGSSKEAADRTIVNDRAKATEPSPGSADGLTAQSARNFSAEKPRGLFSYLKSNLAVIGIICFLILGVLGAGLKYLEEEAQKEVSRRADRKSSPDKQEESLGNKYNPFLPAAPPTTEVQLSKEYIYSGSRMLAVEDSTADSTAGTADLAVWRPSTGVWYVMNGNGSKQTTQQWGLAGDLPAPGDYDGDGKLDFCIFRPSTNAWWIMRSSDSAFYTVPFGVSTDKPVPADFDGDGRTDIAVYRPSNGTWYLLNSTGSYQQYQFGLGSDTPTPKDFDGDGRADLAVWRSSDKTFYSNNSSNNQLRTATFTQSSTTPVPADYDGDGKADHAIRDAAAANWIILNSSNGQSQTIPWQQSTDIEAPSDYDGDGKADIAVWRDSTGFWLIRQSSRIGQPGELRQVQWGASGDIPLPGEYRR